MYCVIGLSSILALQINRAATLFIFKFSSNILCPEPASNFIQLEESSTCLDDSSGPIEQVFPFVLNILYLNEKREAIVIYN